MPINRTDLYCFFLFCQVLFSQQILAEEKPLWEIGAGLGTLTLPHYVGSKQTSSIVIPVPYAIYRGAVLRSKGGGMQGVLFDSRRMKIDVSIGGSIPFDSDGNRAREDMPTLDPIFELGPRLIVRLNDSPVSLHQWRLRIPLRAATSIDDLDMEHRGWIANPTIRYTYDDGGNRWNLTLGPIYGDQRYHNYIYDVEEQYATETRPIFNAESGLTAMRFSVTYTKQTANWQFKFFTSYMSLDDAENKASPLVTTDYYLSGGLAIIRMLGRSREMVHGQR